MRNFIHLIAIAFMLISTVNAQVEYDDGKIYNSSETLESVVEQHTFQDERAYAVRFNDDLNTEYAIVTRKDDRRLPVVFYRSSLDGEILRDTELGFSVDNFGIADTIYSPYRSIITPASNGNYSIIMHYKYSNAFSSWSFNSQTLLHYIGDTTNIFTRLCPEPTNPSHKGYAADIFNYYSSLVPIYINKSGGRRFALYNTVMDFQKVQLEEIEHSDRPIYIDPFLTMNDDAELIVSTITNSENYQSGEIYLSKFTNSFEKIWEKKVKEFSSSGEIVALRAKDGIIDIIFNDNSGMTSTFLNLYWYKVDDSTGDVVSYESLEFDSSEKTIISDVRFDDDKVVIAGSFTSDRYTDQSDNLVLILDSELQELQRFVWGKKEADDRIYGIDLTDGKIFYASESVIRITGESTDFSGTAGYIEAPMITSVEEENQRVELTAGTVYPNPASNEITIESDYEIAQWAIVNGSGHTVATGTGHTLEHDISGLPIGDYTIITNGKGKSTIYRFVKR
jgi:hypothetical protein